MQQQAQNVKELEQLQANSRTQLLLQESVEGLSVVAIGACDMRTCAHGWRLLSAWRARFATLLSTPLVKLQVRVTHNAF